MKTYPNPNPITRFGAAAAFALAVLLFAAVPEAKAQYQMTTLGVAVVENFNGMLVPTAVSGVTNINFNASLANTTQTQRNSAWVLTTARGVGNDTGASTTGGWRAYADANGTDKALGSLGNGSYSSGNATATYLNTSGSAVTSFVFSYTGEQWRGNSGPGSITIQYSINGGTFTALSTSTFTASNTTNAAMNGDNSANRTTGLGATVNSISLANGQNIQFRFQYTIGANSKGVGADDISVTFNGVAAGADLYWTANRTSLGGSGTWNTGGSNWSATAAPVTAATWDSSKKAIFTNSPATVTVDTVTASAGIQFATDGYTLTGGSLSLGGASQAANTITSDASVVATINSKLSGSAGMTKAGAGELVLGGANDYTGGTAVNGGRLIGTTTSLQGDIANEAAVTFDQATNGTYSSAMSGNGSLRKSGASTLTLAGANTYSGGTEVAAGGLIGTTTSLQGAITNNGTVEFNQGTNGAYAGAMTGSGSLTKSGAGDVTLTGANSYSGGTLVSAGGLVGTTTSLQGAITNNTTVTFNQGATGTYAGEMSGSGSLVKAGGGAVTLSASNSYAGGTSINGGSIVSANDDALGSGDVALGSNSKLLAAAGITVGNAITVAEGAAILYEQDFNNIGAGLPTGWTVRTGATSSSLGTSGSFTTTTNDWANVSGAFKNFATATGLTSSATNAEQNASADRALGIRQTSSFGDPGAAFTYAFSTTGETVDSISLDLMMLSVQTRSTTWSIEYGIGAAPTSFTSLGTWADPGTFGTTPLTITSGTFGTALNNQSDVILRVVALTASTGSGNRDSMGIDNVVIGGGAGGPSALAGTIGSDVVNGTATFSGLVTLDGTARLTAASGANVSFSGGLAGDGGIRKIGVGTVTLSGATANTFTGTTTVAAGTLALTKTAGTDAIAGDVAVLSGATLLISADNQVADGSAVTLSGGTISRGAGVDEVFGNLNLTADSFLDFGTGAIGTLQFGTYTPTFKLTVNNFLADNVLVFGTDLSGSINNTSLFAFSNGFTSSWDGSLFTITAVPEPSTYAAAAGLVGLLLWPARRRILRDTQRILGLRRPMRDRLERLRA